MRCGDLGDGIDSAADVRPEFFRVRRFGKKRADSDDGQRWLGCRECIRVFGIVHRIRYHSMIMVVAEADPLKTVMVETGTPVLRVPRA